MNRQILRATAFPAALLMAALTALAEPRLALKMRVYEGGRDASLVPPAFVTSSYMQPTIVANLHTEFDLEKESAQVKRVFNLKDLSLLTEAVLELGEERAGLPADEARHYFRLNGNAFQVGFKLIESKFKKGFVVVFNEIVDEKPVNILTTEVELVGAHTAVLGFEDRKGKPYFCSFHISGPSEMLPPSPPPPPPAPALSDEIKKEAEVFEKGAVKASKTVKPPRLLKSVNPVYPEEAKKQGLAGLVILNARMDNKGNVTKVMVLKSTNEIFNASAIEAVKQWKYEPMVIDGKPHDVVFTVTIRFTLKAETPDPPKPPKPAEPPAPPEFGDRQLNSPNTSQTSVPSQNCLA